MVVAVLIGAGIGLGSMQTSARDKGKVSVFDSIIQSLVAPIARPLRATANSSSDFFGSIGRARSLSAENGNLKAQLTAISMYAERISHLESEVDLLRKNTALPPLPGKERVNADIVGFFQYENRIRLNVGSEKGIKPNMPVVTAHGLVGVIQTVKVGESQAILTTSIGLQIGGIDFSRTPPPAGLIKGRNSSTLVMTLFDPTANVMIGDSIVTSPYSETIPSGILIGRVLQVENDPDYGTRRAILDPSINIGSIREVQVLK